MVHPVVTRTFVVLKNQHISIMVQKETNSNPFVQNIFLKSIMVVLKVILQIIHTYSVMVQMNPIEIESAKRHKSTAIVPQETDDKYIHR